MKIPFFTLSKQNELLQQELMAALNRVMIKGNFILGDEVRQFEESFSNYIGSKACVSCANGTDAIELVLTALQLPPGHEVILPANTWISVAEAVINAGGKPVFADVLENAYNLNPKMVEHLINDRTFAIIAVHQYGKPAPISDLRSAIAGKEIYLIEDCAHATGASYHGIKCGNLADIATFSFYPTKNLGAFGDGGAITTNNDSLAQKVRLLANHGQVSRDRHLLSGRNSRLDEIQAAVLNVKLKYLDDWNRKRRELALNYNEALESSEIQLPEVLPAEYHVFHQYVVRLADRDDLRLYLQNTAGVETKIHYPKPLSTMNFFHSGDSAPISSQLSNQILSLPIYPEMSLDHQQKVIDAFKEFLSPSLNRL